jgi:hypothetical protein
VSHNVGRFGGHRIQNGWDILFGRLFLLLGAVPDLSIHVAMNAMASERNVAFQLVAAKPPLQSTATNTKGPRLWVRELQRLVESYYIP